PRRGIRCAHAPHAHCAGPYPMPGALLSGCGVPLAPAPAFPGLPSDDRQPMSDGIREEGKRLIGEHINATDIDLTQDVAVIPRSILRTVKDVRIPDGRQVIDGDAEHPLHLLDPSAL